MSSDRVILNKANIRETKSAIILAENPLNIESDDRNSSAVSVIEYMNKNIYTIVEKVRLDDVLFSLTNADVIIPVSAPEVITQEILDHGAIELSNAIFDNSIPGTQYNVKYKGDNIDWINIAIKLLEMGLIPEGFKKENEKFNVLPKPKDKITSGTIIKYRGEKRLLSLN